MDLEHGLDPDNRVGYVQYYGVKVIYDAENGDGYCPSLLSLSW